MTTGISLVRENAATMQPPRSLWVTFPLGRPLGKPNDAAFQHRVIAAALELLDRRSGPVLEDYPEDVPTVDIASTPTCPVSFAKTLDDADTWQARLAIEFTQLEPWYALGRRRRNGRSLVGASNHSVQENLQKLGKLLDAGDLPTTDLKWFKLAIEDAKVFYLEALMAQPGEYVHDKLHDILWHDTQLGAALIRFYHAFEAHPKLSLIARIVASRDAIDRAKHSTTDSAIDTAMGEAITAGPYTIE